VVRPNGGQRSGLLRDRLLDHTLRCGLEVEGAGRLVDSRFPANRDVRATGRESAGLRRFKTVKERPQAVHE
jgi:hypothetical protein